MRVLAHAGRYIGNFVRVSDKDILGCLMLMKFRWILTLCLIGVVFLCFSQRIHWPGVVSVDTMLIRNLRGVVTGDIDMKWFFVRNVQLTVTELLKLLAVFYALNTLQYVE